MLDGTDSGLFDTVSSDLNMHQVILGMCCFISAFVIFIGCMIGMRYRKNKAKTNKQSSQWKYNEKPTSIHSYYLSPSTRMDVNPTISGSRHGRLRQIMGESYMGSRWRGSMDEMSTSSRYASRDGLTCENLEMSSRASPNISDLAFCVKTSDIVLHKTLGEGFYGKVLSARWQGNWVAIKIIKHKKADQLIEVQNEVALLIRLRHPNVLPFYGCTAPPEPYIISELQWGSLFKLLHGDNPVRGGIIEGSSSSTGRKVEQPLSELVLFRIVNDISNGLSYIHDSGIIHRDVSSSNVLVTGPREKLEELVRKDGLNVPAFAKITDFGLSRDTASGHTSSAVNLLYLAPEVYRGETVTTQSDVFSFAIVVWEAYICKRPYGDQANEQIAAYRVTCEGLRPPVTSNIPRGISILMQDCWVDDQQARPTMKAVVVFLEELQGLWRSHAKANQTDENDTDYNSKWDGVAMKPAVNTYSEFDADDYNTVRDVVRNDSHLSFRIGDIHVMDDDDSDQENNIFDVPQTGLTLDDEDNDCSESSSAHYTRQRSESSSSSCSLEGKAEAAEQLRSFSNPSFVPTPFDGKGGGYGTVNDVYHEFLHGSPLGISRNIKEEVDKQPDVPAVGESNEHGGSGNYDAAAGNEG